MVGGGTEEDGFEEGSGLVELDASEVVAETPVLGTGEFGTALAIEAAGIGVALGAAMPRSAEAAETSVFAGAEPAAGVALAAAVGPGFIKPSASSMKLSALERLELELAGGFKFWLPLLTCGDMTPEMCMECVLSSKILAGGEAQEGGFTTSPAKGRWLDPWLLCAATEKRSMRGSSDESKSISRLLKASGLLKNPKAEHRPME